MKSLRDPVVESPRGYSYADSFDSWKNYSRSMKQLMREWNSRVDWSPKDLRNCLPTFAVTQGIHSDLWEQYIGHVPRSVTAKHYIPRLASASLGESDALERQMNILRMHIVDAIDEAVEKVETVQKKCTVMQVAYLPH